ncbi:helix-turn-helix transcriptional regulator [Bradyrhizobium sp. CCGB12]|uniref:helix-turn-helix transcriptional regulator n=1 Tax=Bradyrhizobium sp. CCGB12 TaxID=2949632 RepID=UPI0035BF32CB
MKVHQEQSRRLRAIEAAKYLRVSRSTLAKWRMAKIGPPHHRCGSRLVYYFVHEIDAWLATCDAAVNGQPR